MKRTLCHALYYALYLLPPATVVPVGSVYLLWLASAAVMATAVRWLCEQGSLALRVVAFLLNAVTAIANILLAVSVVMQGHGFDAQFFAHANWQTLVVASEVMVPLVAGCSIYWLFVCIWPSLLGPGASTTAPPADARAAAPRTLPLTDTSPLRRNRVRSSSKVAGLVAFAVAVNGPVLSLVWYAVADLMAARQEILVPKPANAPIAADAGKPKTNLVLVFAEAMEETYSEPAAFGADMTPRLTALARQGLRFTNMRQVSHTGWTTGALVAATCALPMGPESHRESLLNRFDFDARVPGVVCLGDVLSAHDYRTVFMGGGRLSFADKGTFLAEHGFRERHGLRTLRPLLDDPNYVSGWGIYDDSLFALAARKLAELDDGAAPYGLALLTLDTHSPGGHPSASCGEPEAGAGKLFSVRCSDRLIADFIETTRMRHPDALIVLFSDHLVPFDSVLVSRLRPFGEQRRLRFVAWGPRIEPGEIDRRGTHFDVTPTVLDLLGIDGWDEHNLGVSLLRRDSPWFHHPHPYRLRVVIGAPDVVLQPHREITFDPEGPAIEVDDNRVLATARGLTLRDAAFAIAFDADGRAKAVQHFRAADLRPDSRHTLKDDSVSEALAAWAAGRSVVGVSSATSFNRRILREQAAIVFFAGRFGTDAFVAGPLRSRRTVVLP